MKPEDFGITKYRWNNDKLDVYQDVNLAHKKLKQLPFQFGIVNGDFFCNHNQLTSLEGAPSKVGNDFWCHDNQLTSLKGAPSEVGGGFWCNDNQLTSLEDAPNKVGCNFWCFGNQLSKLQLINTLFYHFPHDMAHKLADKIDPTYKNYLLNYQIEKAL